MKTQPSSIKAKALRLLAQRDYSYAELNAKLQKWLQTKNQQMQEDDAATVESLSSEQMQEIADILNEFQQRGWVSDQRVVEAVIYQKAPRLGQARLRQELKAKGLDESVVQEALSELKESEFERACAVWQRKFSNFPSDANSYQKQARFLTYRGFSSEVTRKVLAGGWNNIMESGT
ncbi:Regulatory protein RecX [Saezia sanguinis]|uniref:Regulatory protein RecX n=1 Tax=Saezia sanguinis TaxID=1965230 RepID=A0A433SCM6_9BURK|nr:regulatory protein RecX [Saezia sanguinis]RUS66436.1 Regulatory protein RecX [Saezia sanguinis]